MIIEKINLDIADNHLDESRAASMPTLDFYSGAQRINSYEDFMGIQANAVYNDVNMPISVTSLMQPHAVKAGLKLNYKASTSGELQTQADKRKPRQRWHARN
jgi:hypothetical protein